MNRPSRFARTTASLDLSALLSPLRQFFWLSLGTAILLNAILVLLNPFQQQAEKAPRPLTTKFIKRQPRLTKALELRKIPQRKRPMIRRRVRGRRPHGSGASYRGVLHTRHHRSLDRPSEYAPSRTDQPTNAPSGTGTGHRANRELGDQPYARA